MVVGPGWLLSCPALSCVGLQGQPRHATPAASPVKAGWARTEQPEGGGKDFNARMRDLLGSEQAWDDVKSGAMASWFRNG